MEKIYPYAVSKLKMYEISLFNHMQYINLAESSMEKILQEMQDHKYDTSIIKRPEECEEIFKNEKSKLFKLINELIPEEKFTDLFLIKNDYHNIKVLLKHQIARTDYQNVNKVFKEDSKNTINQNDYKNYLIEGGIFKVKEIEEIVLQNKFQKLPEKMQQGINETIKAIYGKQDKSQLIDLILDRTCYEHMNEIAKLSKNEFIINYVDMICDLMNIKIFIRIKKYSKGIEVLNTAYINSGKLSKEFFIKAYYDDYMSKLKQTDYKNLIEEILKPESNLEMAIDNYIMNFLKQAKLKTLTIEPIVAYIYAKEIEIKNLRIIFNGKLNGLNSKNIIERLRESYV